MKDRLITVVGGLLAFALVVILLAPMQRDEAPSLSRPVSDDRGRQGLEGLKRWLDSGGVHSDVLRRRYTSLLASTELSPQGNLLISSLPQRASSRRDERTALRAWLEQGNSALVLVAAGDVPPWSLEAAGESGHVFLEELGFELTMGDEGKWWRPEEKDDDGEGGESGAEARTLETLTDIYDGFSGDAIALEPRFDHPLTRGVTSVAARSVRVLDRDWQLEAAEGGRAVLPLLSEHDHGPAFWEIRVGTGRVWVSRYADLFGNVMLGKGDNARLMGNLLAASLGSHGRVLFDDMHQGASDLYDPKAFFNDSRFIKTMAFLAGFWLLYLVGSSRRLAPPREIPQRYYAADLARAMAGLFARRVSVVSIQRQLFSHFFNEIRARYGLPTNGEPVWSMLSDMARVSTDNVERLQAHYERAAKGERADLVALTRLMQRTRESLS